MDIKLKTLSMHQPRGFAEHEPYVNPISLLAPDLYLLLGIEIPLPRQFRKRQLGPSGFKTAAVSIVHCQPAASARQMNPFYSTQCARISYSKDSL